MSQTQIHKYVVINKIGEGHFGVVYKGKNRKTGELVAIKRATNPEKNLVQHETAILNFLYHKSCRNIPMVYWFGLATPECPVLVMTHYDGSLFDIFTLSKWTGMSWVPNEEMRIGPPGKNNEKAFTEWLMKKIVSIIKQIHGCGVVHRDLKPHNFMWKNGDLFLIDFGMATFYVDENYQHIPEPVEPKCHLLGTLKYISYHIHNGCEYSRRDDMISIGYIYMFLKGILYWERQFGAEPDTEYPETHIRNLKNQCVRASKRLDTIETFLNTNGLKEDHLQEYLRRMYSLGFYETPNYDV